MLKFSQIKPDLPLGKLLRALLKVVPKSMIIPILQGPLRGMKWIVGSANHGCWLGTYEHEKQEALLRYVQQGQVVYDIGAHVGFYTLFFSKFVGAKGEVVAFEPFPENYHTLRRHLIINNINNVSLHEYAIADKNGDMLFFPHLSSYCGRLWRQANYYPNNLIRVFSIKLDDFVFQQRKRPPHLIKMDIEGAEDLACLGMKKVLKDCRPIVFLSLHRREVAESCSRIFHRLNYKMYALTGEPLDISRQFVDEVIVIPSDHS